MFLKAAWSSIALLFPIFATSISLTPQDQQNPILSHDDFFPPLNYTSPSPLVLHSLASLLQTWPNTFYPAGHTIIPCTIPAHTTVYHARGDEKSPPPSPEWLAFDWEMSYGIFGLGPTAHMLTYSTTRDVRCIYFDGTSAALMRDGSMDSQMVFIHNSSAAVPSEPIFGKPPDNACEPGEVPKDGHNCTLWNPLQAEYDRANGLCDFIRENGLGGRGWGFESIVRMNAGFEAIWCDFESPSLELLSHVNIGSPLLEGVDVPDWPPPDDDTTIQFKPTMMSSRSAMHTLAEKSSPRRPFVFIEELPFWLSSIYNWFAAATRTYGSVGGRPGRGETRIRLDACRMFTFYEPGMADQERARVRDETAQFKLGPDGYWTPPEQTSEQNGALQNMTRRRRHQRVLNVSVADGKFMRTAVTDRLRNSLDGGDAACSSFDWPSMAQDLMIRYSNPLREFAALLNAQPTALHGNATRDHLAAVRRKAHKSVASWYSYPPWTPANASLAFAPTTPSTLAAFDRCVRHTLLSNATLAPGEVATYSAFREVANTLCHATLHAFLATEAQWLTHFNNISAPPPAERVQREVLHSTKKSLGAIEQLMAWLGWADQWTDCQPACGKGEYCFIPMFPILGLSAFGRRRNETQQDPRSLDELVEDWIFSPTCLDIDGVGRGTGAPAM